jgi:hypothetical protein
VRPSDARLGKQLRQATPFAKRRVFSLGIAVANMGTLSHEWQPESGSEYGMKN